MTTALGDIVLYLVATVSAGLVGAGVMVLFLKSLPKLGIAEVDMLGAVGSLFTKSIDSAHLVGGIMHASAGILFAMLYAIIFGFFEVNSFFGFLFAGGFLGFVHGFVMCFILVAVIAEHHPLPQYREPGMAVAVAHLVGHILYGLTVGAVLGVVYNLSKV